MLAGHVTLLGIGESDRESDRNADREPGKDAEHMSWSFDVPRKLL